MMEASTLPKTTTSTSEGGTITIAIQDINTTKSKEINKERQDLINKFTVNCTDHQSGNQTKKYTANTTPIQSKNSAVRHLSIVKNISELESKLVFDSNRNAACPLCSEKKFKRCPIYRLKRHFLSHRSSGVLCGGWIVLSCHLKCRGHYSSRAHYHCPECSMVLTRKQCFFTHAKICLEKRNKEPLLASFINQRYLLSTPSTSNVDHTYSSTCASKTSRNESAINKNTDPEDESMDIEENTNMDNSNRQDNAMTTEDCGTTNNNLQATHNNTTEGMDGKVGMSRIHDQSVRIETEQEQGEKKQKHISIVKCLQDLEAQVKYDEDKRGLCPLCPSKMVKGAPLYQLRRHFKSHQKQSVTVAGMMVLECYLPCKQDKHAHFHCPMCNRTMSGHKHFSEHVKKCETRQDNPQLNEMEESSQEHCVNIRNEHQTKKCRRESPDRGYPQSSIAGIEEDVHTENLIEESSLDFNKAICNICGLKETLQNIKYHYESKHKDSSRWSKYTGFCTVLKEFTPKPHISTKASASCNSCGLVLLMRNMKRHYQTKHNGESRKWTDWRDFCTIVTDHVAKPRYPISTKVRCNVCDLEMLLHNLRRHYDTKHIDPAREWTHYLDYCTITGMVSPNKTADNSSSSKSASEQKDALTKKSKKKRKRRIQYAVCSRCQMKMLRRNVKRHYQIKHPELSAIYERTSEFYSVIDRRSTDVIPIEECSSDGNDRDIPRGDEHKTDSNVLKMYSLNQPKIPSVLGGDSHVSHSLPLPCVNTAAHASNVALAVALPNAVLNPNPSLDGTELDTLNVEHTVSLPPSSSSSQRV